MRQSPSLGFAENKGVSVIVKFAGEATVLRLRSNYMSMGEAHRRITEYLNRFSDAISSQDGATFKSLFALSSNSPFLLSLGDALNLFQDPNRLIKQSDNYSQFADILVPLFRSLLNYRQNNLLEAYNAFEKTAKYFYYFPLLIFLTELNFFVC